MIASETVDHVEADDGQLIVQIESGSTAAFETLYDLYYARAYRLAMGVCRDDGLAEEAVQEAFTAIWRNPKAYRPDRGSVVTWLLSVVQYRAIDVARANGKHANRRADEHQGPERDGPGDTAGRVEAEDEASSLSALLSRLPESQREVIALAFYGELTHAEISSQLGLPPGTVKGRMRLGLQKLRGYMDHGAATDRRRAALTFALYAGDFDQASRIVQDASNEVPAATMLDDVMAPAMHHIGGLWERSEITIADEHLATGISHRLLTGVSAALRTTSAKRRETVLLATPEPEEHTLGLLMADAVLSGAGYNTVLLGAGIPATALSAALLRHQPAIVALSSSIYFEDALAVTAAIVRRTLPAAELVIGGAAATRFPRDIAAHRAERLDGLLATVDTFLGYEQG